MPPLEEVTKDLGLSPRPITPAYSSILIIFIVVVDVCKCTCVCMSVYSVYMSMCTCMCVCMNVCVEGNMWSEDNPFVGSILSNRLHVGSGD